MSLTDAQRLWVWLRDAGSEGVHSHEIRKAGYSGNPSSRMKDIVSKGQSVFTVRESRNGRPGARYWLQEHAPDCSVAVLPNHASESAAAPREDTGARLEKKAERPYVLIRETSGKWREVAA